MGLINKEDLLEALEERYGDLSDDAGCTVLNNGEYEWLSLRRIFNIIENCTEYED